MPFRDIVGHARLIELLSRSIAANTLPPSLVLAGPSGIGKRLAALSVAQALNCLSPQSYQPSAASSQPQTPSTRHPAPSTKHPAPSTKHPAPSTRHPAPSTRHPAPSTRHPAPSTRHQAPGTLHLTDACGVCAACTRIARGVHPDVLLVEPGDSGTIKIDQVREIVDRAGYRPFEGRRRAVIIDEADALVIPAQNALLKTLEEPPPSSVFMLVTSRPDVLLPTVRSRCPQLRFRPLPERDLARALVARGYAESEARAVAVTADGSLGRALEASAGDLVEAREIAQRVLAGVSAARDAGGRLESAKDLLAKTGAGGAGDRDQLSTHLRAMASLLRDVEVLAAHADVRTLANADVQPALEKLTAAYQGERGMRAFAAVDQALVALERNAGVKLVADWLVLQL